MRRRFLREPGIGRTREMTHRLYCVVDWLALHPEYGPRTKVIPKKDYSVLVDAKF